MHLVPKCTPISLLLLRPVPDLPCPALEGCSEVQCLDVFPQLLQECWASLFGSRWAFCSGSWATRGSHCQHYVSFSTACQSLSSAPTAAGSSCSPGTTTRSGHVVGCAQGLQAACPPAKRVCWEIFSTVLQTLCADTYLLFRRQSQTSLG